MRVVVVITALTFLGATYAQYPDPSSQSSPDWRQEIQRREELRRIEEKTKRASEENEDTRRRLENLEKSVADSEFEFRYPTPDEVKAAQAEWHKAHPFTSSAELPDFANKKIKVQKSVQASSSIEYLQAQVNALNRKIEASKKDAEIAELRAQIALVKQKSGEPTDKLQQRPISKPGPQSVTGNSGYKPASSRSIVSRKMSDGTVIAIIGEKTRKFPNEAEFQKFAAGLEIGITELKQ